MEGEHQSDLPISVFSNSLQVKMFNIPRCHILDLASPEPHQGQSVFFLLLPDYRVSGKIPSGCFIILRLLGSISAHPSVFIGAACKDVCGPIRWLQSGRAGFFTAGRPPTFNMLICIEIS